MRDGELTIKTISAHELQIKDHTETEIRELITLLDFSLLWIRFYTLRSSIYFVFFFPSQGISFITHLDPDFLFCRNLQCSTH